MPKRLHRVYRAVGSTLVAAVLVACSTASAVRPVPLSQLADDDQIFVQLREAARANDPAHAAQLARMLPNYPAPSYLEYFHLKPQRLDSEGHAHIDAPDEPVLSFLQRY